MGKKVCFAGHRRIIIDKVEKTLTKAIISEIQNGCKHFIVGTNGSFDRLALYVLRQLKKAYPDVVIELALTSLNALKTLTPSTDVKTVMFDNEQVHFKRRITEKNRKIVDSCDVMIAYVNENEVQSGAKATFNYAKQKGLRIINLYES